ncbi:unnamed protein product [marine sediment metagenome]|uniref:Uncharacterized protein n=1 Tax=marine sediment metagenome TaxID=412755 RepID=X1KX23_9ZZZZ
MQEDMRTGLAQREAGLEGQAVRELQEEATVTLEQKAGILAELGAPEAKAVEAMEVLAEVVDIEPVEQVLLERRVDTLLPKAKVISLLMNL